MNAPQPTPRDPVPNSHERDDQDLEQQIRHLQERLAFYEGFDVLIQDNVAHARELFRLAAQEREAAAANADRTRQSAAQREAALRAEFGAIAAELQSLAKSVDALARRVATVLGEPMNGNGKLEDTAVLGDQPVAIVVHGVPSARTALSLQRFVGTLPQVSDVSAREFAGGVFRLDARVRDRLEANQFGAWEDARHIQLLTERPDVIEFALEETEIVVRANG